LPQILPLPRARKIQRRRLRATNRIQGDEQALKAARAPEQFLIGNRGNVVDNRKNAAIQ